MVTLLNSIDKTEQKHSMTKKKNVAFPIQPLSQQNLIFFAKWNDKNSVFNLGFEHV